MATEKNIGFFDIETQYLFDEIDPNWSLMSWDEKIKVKPELAKRLKLALAGLLINDPPIRFFRESDINELFLALDSIDFIVGHNLLNFDYIVLSRYFSKKQIDKLVSKTIDTLFEIEKIKGIWASLDDLGKLNLGIQKLENTRGIPKLWRQGNYERVRDYLERDIEILKKVFIIGRREGKLKYLHKEYGEIKGVRIVNVNW